jgi:hypothetical protein
LPHSSETNQLNTKPNNMNNFEKEYNEACRNYAQGRKFETYVEELFDGQEKFFGELRVDGTFDCDKGLEDVKIMLVDNGLNESPIAVDITAMVSEAHFDKLLELAHERVAEELNKAYKEIYECMP